MSETSTYPTWTELREMEFDAILAWAFDVQRNHQANQELLEHAEQNDADVESQEHRYGQ